MRKVFSQFCKRNSLNNDISEGVGRWAVNTAHWTPHEAEWNTALELLPQEEQERVKQFAKNEDRKQTLVSRLLQRLCLAEKLGIAPCEAVIERTTKGKPFLSPQTNRQAPFPNFNFNATHHGSFVAVACEPVCCVGIDVMDETYMSRGSTSVEEFFSSFQKNFTQHEWATIRSVPDPRDQLRQFHRHWAMKEAFIKAHGQGIGFCVGRLEMRYHTLLDTTTTTTNCHLHTKHRTQSVQTNTNNDNHNASLTSPFSSPSTQPPHTIITPPPTPTPPTMPPPTTTPTRRLQHEAGVWGEEAEVRVDGCVVAPQWSLHVVYLDHTHVCCVARGASQNVHESFRSTLDLPFTPPDLYARGLSLPHGTFDILSANHVIKRLLSFNQEAMQCNRAYTHISQEREK